MRGHETVVRLLLGKNPAVDMINLISCGRTALMLAAEDGCKAVVQRLLDKYAAVNVKDDSGPSPLLRAIQNHYKARRAAAGRHERRP